MEDRVLRLSTGDVHYLAAGAGPPLLLLHGLGASVVTWHRNVEALAARHAVYAPDLPGCGDSTKPDIAYTWEDGERFVSEFLDAVSVDRVGVVGNSMGGLLAARLAFSRPERVYALVLVAPVGLGPELPFLVRLASLPLAGPLLDWLDTHVPHGFMRSVFYRPDMIEPQVYGELLRVRRLPGASRMLLRALRNGANLRGLRRHLLLGEALRHVQAPTLVLWGREDRILPVRHAYQVAEEQSPVQVRVLPGCGHWPHFECAEAFHREVIPFLEAAAAQERTKTVGGTV
ncbi:MAG: alpha/beta fold hydrolase [Chloroflexi bacterium]|nr:alpha/beta fold hydrolase [Chloroflexota bacterium]